MSLLTVFVATRMEAQPLQRAMKRIDLEAQADGRRRAYANQIRWFITGIGPQAASHCAARVFAPRHENLPLALRQPEVALVTGLCGGISPAFSAKTVIAYTRCLSHTPGSKPLDCSELLTATYIASLRAQGLACHRAVGITVPKIAASIAAKRELAQRGADVLDMESYPIIQAAEAAGVPIAVVRIVSDSVDQAIPDFNPALEPGGTVRRLAAARTAIRSPYLTACLLAANRRALRTLTDVLHALLLNIAP